MKQSHILSLLASLLVVSAGILMLGGTPGSASAAVGAASCAGSQLLFPASGVVGWTWQDPGATDRDSTGNRTLHTGVDIFGDAGDGSAIYAPADGFVARGPGLESVNIVLPGVRNVLTGDMGIELYLTHIRHALVFNQAFKAGDVIATQIGDHLHFSIGAFVGYDDREISQTQDPSQYFNATLRFNPNSLDRFDMLHWCYAAGSFQALQALETTPAASEPAELRIGRQDCLPDGRVAIMLPPNTVRAGDWVDLSIFNNDFTSDFIGMQATSGIFRWEGLKPASPHFLRVNRPIGSTWVASSTVLFLTRNDC